MQTKSIPCPCRGKGRNKEPVLMEFAFYFAAGIAAISTLRVITHTNPMHALLYLIVSLLAVSMCFFSLGAPFAGAL